MKRTIHIKLRLPYNMEPMRKYGLYFDRLPKQLIMAGQCRKFEIGEEEQTLMVKLDYFKSKVLIPAGNGDVYVTIAMKGDTVMGWFLHSFTRRALLPKVVSKEEFDAFDHYYDNFGNAQPLKRIDSVSFILSLGVMAYLLYATFTGDPTDDIASLVWATAVIGVTTLLILWKDRKKLSVFTYKSRMFLFGGLLAVTTFTMTLEHGLELGWLVVLLPLTVLARTWVVDKEVGRPA